MRRTIAAQEGGIDGTLRHSVKKIVLELDVWYATRNHSDESS